MFIFRATNLKSACQLAQSQLSRSQEAIQGFRTKLVALSEWIENSGFKFLQQNTEFGQNHESSIKFLSQHKDLFNRAHLKTFELEGLRGALKTIADQCSNGDTRDVEQMMNQLSNKLSSLKSSLGIRISISEKCDKFYKLYGQLDNEMRHVEGQFERQNVHSNDFKTSFEESRLLIQQLYLQVILEEQRSQVK